MRCNWIFLHQEEPPKRLMEEEGGEDFSFGFLVSYDCSFCSAGRTLEESCWMKTEIQEAASELCWFVGVFFHHFGSKGVFFLSTIFSKFFCESEVKSCSVQVFLVLWMSKRTGVNVLLLRVEITLEQLHAEGSA